MQYKKDSFFATNLLRASPFLREIMCYGGARLFTLCIPFITVPIITRYLTPSDYGVLSVVSSITAWLIMIIGLGGTGPITRYFILAEEEKEKQIVVSSWIWWTFMVILLVCTIVGWQSNFFAKLLLGDNKFGIYLLIGCMSASLIYIGNILANIIRFELQAKKFSLFQVSSALITALFSIIAVITHHGVLGVLTAQLIAALVMLIPYTFSVQKYLSPIIDRRCLCKQLRYGIPLVPASVMWYGLTSIDRVILIHHSVNEVGLYSVAARLCQLIAFVNTAFGMAWSPRAFRVYKENPSDAPKIYGKVL